MLYGYIDNVEWEMGCSTPPCFVSDCKLPRFEIYYVPFLEDKDAKKS